jgi:outer membrane protein TolC
MGWLVAAAAAGAAEPASSPDGDRTLDPPPRPEWAHEDRHLDRFEAVTLPAADAALPTPLTLADAQRIAIRHNPGLAAVGERVAQASAQVRQAVASYWPTAVFDGAGSRNALSDRRLEAERLLIPDQEASTTEFTARVAGAWLLFDGFNREYTVAAARHGRSESRAATLDARRLLLSVVAETYYEAQLARQNMRIAEADISFNQRLLHEARMNRQAGLGSSTDEKNFQVRVNASRSILIQQNATLEAAFIALAALMGVEGSRFAGRVSLVPLGEETETELAAPDETSEIAYALDHRPDLQASLYAIQRARATVGQSMSDLWPNLSATAAYQGIRPDDPSFGGEDVETFYGIALTFDLFTGRARAARRAEARSLLREARHRVAHIQLTLAAEIRQAIVTVQAAQQVLTLQNDNTQLVKEVRDIAELEYRAGETSLVRLNEAQRDLVTAEAERAAARVRLRLAWQDLHTATGRALESTRTQGLGEMDRSR